MQILMNFKHLTSHFQPTSSDVLNETKIIYIFLFLTFFILFIYNQKNIILFLWLKPKCPFHESSHLVLQKWNHWKMRLYLFSKAIMMRKYHYYRVEKCGMLAKTFLDHHSFIKSQFLFWLGHTLTKKLATGSPISAWSFR